MEGRGEKEERGKRRGEKKKKRRERKKTEFHSRARTRDLPLCSQPPMATAWRVDSQECTIHVYIANFDFDDLTVAALAAPISMHAHAHAHCRNNFPLPGIKRCLRKYL